MPHVEIRPASVEDAPATAAILREMSEELNSTPRQPHEVPTAAEDAEAIRRIARDGGVWLVAVEDGVVVGWVNAQRGKRDSMKHVADLGITLTRSARGRGIGEQLMRALEAWARASGVRKLTLGVFRDNERAVRLYRRLGYQVDGVRTGMAILGGRVLDEVLMSKDLA